MRRFGETNEFDKDFKSLDKKVNMSEEEHKEVLSQIKMGMEKESAGQKKSSPWKAYLAVAASAFILFLLAMPFFSDNIQDRLGSLKGDAPEETPPGVETKDEPITDTDSEQVLTNEISQLESNMEVFQIYQDGMMLGERYPEKAVVDLSYYEENPIERGDVVRIDVPENEADAYGNPGKKEGRVIGLPGEHLKIESGQIYIDNRKLDTFYGKLHYWPWPGEGQEAIAAEDVEGERGAMFDNEEVQIPEDHYFITGDNWFRSGVGIGEGTDLVPFPKNYIEGKVIGYYEQK